VYCSLFLHVPIKLIRLLFDHKNHLLPNFPAGAGNFTDHYQLSARQGTKNARISSKTFAILAEPRLFKRMALVPYVDCLEEFASMMCNNKIA
jgi:hypothetical protein